MSEKKNFLLLTNVHVLYDLEDKTSKKTRLQRQNELYVSMCYEKYDLQQAIEIGLYLV